MSVLSITLLHAAVLRTFFGVFLHVVRGRIGDDPGRGHRMTHVLGESDFTAPRLPGTSISPCEQELVGAILLTGSR